MNSANRTLTRLADQLNVALSASNAKLDAAQAVKERHIFELQVSCIVLFLKNNNIQLFLKKNEKNGNYLFFFSKNEFILFNNVKKMKLLKNQANLKEAQRDAKQARDDMDDVLGALQVIFLFQIRFIFFF